VDGFFEQVCAPGESTGFDMSRKYCKKGILEGKSEKSNDSVIAGALNFFSSRRDRDADTRNLRDKFFNHRTCPL